jgi:hypothetical protein
MNLMDRILGFIRKGSAKSEGKLTHVLRLSRDLEIKPRREWSEVRSEIFYGFSPRTNRLESVLSPNQMDSQEDGRRQPRDEVT